MLHDEADLKSHVLGAFRFNRESPGRVAADMQKTPNGDLVHELLSRPPSFHQQGLLVPTIL